MSDRIDDGDLRIPDTWQRADSSGSWWDFTFSPWWGCEKVSAACKHCYAEATDSCKGPYLAGLSGQPPTKHWGRDAPRLFMSEERWKEPLAWDRKAQRDGRRYRVFCASMCDVFEDRDELVTHRDRLWEIAAETPHLIWQVLTKRPENFSRFLPWGSSGDPLPNVCLGVTAENQATADERVPLLLATPALIRFVSYEPALGSIDSSRFLVPQVGRGLDWIITGDEDTRRDRARMTDLDWIRAVRDQCVAAHVAFHFKQWAGRAVPGIGGERDKRGKIHLPLLDGRRWAEFPALSHVEFAPPELQPSTSPERIDAHHEETELHMGPRLDPDEERNEANNNLPDGSETLARPQVHDPSRERARSLIENLKAWSQQTELAIQIVSVLTHYVDKQSVWKTAGYQSLDAYLRDTFGFTSEDPIYAKRMAAGSKIFKFMPTDAWDWVRRFEENASAPDPAEARRVYAEAERKRLEERGQPRRANSSKPRNKNLNAAGSRREPGVPSQTSALPIVPLPAALAATSAPPTGEHVQPTWQGTTVPMPPAPVALQASHPVQAAHADKERLQQLFQPAGSRLDHLFQLLIATEAALDEQSRNAALAPETRTKIGIAVRRIAEIAQRARFEPGPPGGTSMPPGVPPFRR